MYVSKSQPSKSHSDWRQHPACNDWNITLQASGSVDDDFTWWNPSTKIVGKKTYVRLFLFHIHSIYLLLLGQRWDGTNQKHFYTMLVIFQYRLPTLQKLVNVHPFAKKTTLANPSSKLQTIICLWLVMIVCFFTPHHLAAGIVWHPNMMFLIMFDGSVIDLNSPKSKTNLKINESENKHVNSKSESQIPRIWCQPFFKHHVFFDVWFVLAEVQR